MISDQIQQWARFCKEAGLTVFYGSPGSRSAPLVLALTRIGGFQIEMVMDERSAAFQALGYALASGKPVGIFCTSGSAVLNYGPAISEAYFQQIPLFVFTADRPSEWIDQHEGQAIHQRDVFFQHTRFSAELPSTESTPQALKQSLRLLQQAFFYANRNPAGPVHLNIPLREPLYPAAGASGISDLLPPNVLWSHNSEGKLSREDLSHFLEIWQKTEKRLVLVGQTSVNPDLANHTRALHEYSQVPVCGDITHNLHQAGLNHLSLSHDSYPAAFWDSEANAPELLVTIGKGLITKSFRSFLQKFPANRHWHIEDSTDFPADPYFSLSDWIRCNPSWFIGKLAEVSYFGSEASGSERTAFHQSWKDAEVQARKRLSSSPPYLEGWSDFSAVFSFLEAVPEVAGLFYGNSMAIRYGCWLGAFHKQTQTIWSNRGTSGIDGCVSTAIGIAQARPFEPLFLVLGDMSFQYDRNGLWRETLPANLKIVVLNNGGGNIFRILPGSGSMPELEPYFELNQMRNARSEAEAMGLPYFRVQNESEMKSVFPDFLQGGCCIMECFTDKVVNASQVKSWRQSS